MKSPKSSRSSPTVYFAITWSFFFEMFKFR
nr:MAG TPA: hypothetical protein [Caudoviricetes sp.]